MENDLVIVLGKYFVYRKDQNNNENIAIFFMNGPGQTISRI
jgi:hypothetical protein